MASKSSLVFVLILVIVGTAAALIVLPAPDVRDQGIQNHGKYAVDVYNKKGNPHLNFIQVLNATVIEEAYFKHVVYLELKAANCSQSGTEALYIAEFIYTLEYQHDGSRKQIERTGGFYRK